MFRQEFKDLVNEGKVYDLGQPWHPGMPHHPLHPPFAYSMARKHGDIQYEGGGSSANDIFTLGGHTGTHMDAVGHFSKDGKLYGGIDAQGVQDDLSGLMKRSIEEIPPVIARGILLDIPRSKGLDVLEKGYPISAKDIRETMELLDLAIMPGDAVLVRTGWARFWGNPRLFNDHGGVPGIDLDAAHFLAEKGICLVGADTTACEVVPSSSLEVHVFLLVQRGIWIIEMLNLEELSREGVMEFLFIAIPLKIKGATGSPVRPIAVR